MERYQTNGYRTGKLRGYQPRFQPEEDWIREERRRREDSPQEDRVRGDPPQSQLLKVDQNKPGLVVSNSDYWANAKKAVSNLKEQVGGLSKGVEQVPQRTKQIGQQLLAQADKVGSAFPDLVTPLKRLFS